jgi:hypothetical protein
MPLSQSRRIVSALLALAALAWVTPAQASFIQLTNPNQFAPNSTLITFDEDGLQPFQIVTSYLGVGFQLPNMPGQGPSVAFDPTPPREFGPGGFAGRTIIQTGFGTGGLRITLPGSETQFGAELLAVTPGNYTFTLFSRGAVVDTVSLPASTGQEYFFYAFQDSEAFDQVIVLGPAVEDGRVILDNLRFGGPAAVPEPTSLALALTGMGLAGLAAAVRRRRLSVRR